MDTRGLDLNGGVRFRGRTRSSNARKMLQQVANHSQGAMLRLRSIIGFSSWSCNPGGFVRGHHWPASLHTGM